MLLDVRRSHVAGKVVRKRRVLFVASRQCPWVWCTCHPLKSYACMCPPSPPLAPSDIIYACMCPPARPP